MIQGVETGDQEGAEVDTGSQAETCSVEVYKSVKAWHVGAVERLPHQVRIKTNQRESFRDEDDDENEEDKGDDTEWPPL
eukprot:4513509-Karenia_brevis.AAC.1